jgi:hypothetical protein
MLYTFIYYLGVTSSACALLGSSLYYFNRPAFNNLAREIGWFGLKAVSFIYTTYDSLVDVSPKNLCCEIEEEDEDKRIVSYSLASGEMKTTANIPPSYDMLFVKKKLGDRTYCKRIHAGANLETLTFTAAQKPFIQIELKYDDRSIEIQDYLDYFYIVDNHILDTTFLKWYMKYWYHITLPTDYSLHIIDSEVNIISLSAMQSILVNKDHYTIVTCKDDVDEDDENISMTMAEAHESDEEDASAADDEGSKDK